MTDEHGEPVEAPFVWEDGQFARWTSVGRRFFIHFDAAGKVLDAVGHPLDRPSDFDRLRAWLRNTLGF